MKLSVSSIQSSVLTNLRLQSCDQSCEHPLNFNNMLFQRTISSDRQYSKVSRKKQKIFNLPCKSHGHTQKSLKLESASAAAPLCDICQDRIGCPSELRSEFKALFQRERSGAAVERLKCMALLPHFQGLKVLQGSPLLHSSVLKIEY
jgi:hypothetical protein